MTKLSGTLLIFSAAISGCATPTAYEGSVVNCDGIPLSEYKVVAFENGWVPFTLPPSVGCSLTDKHGLFQFTASDTADFFVIVGPADLTIHNHPQLSVSLCPE